jgi:hypothetical protein
MKNQKMSDEYSSDWKENNEHEPECRDDLFYEQIVLAELFGRKFRRIERRWNQNEA